MAPLSSRACNCGPNVSFCESMPVHILYFATGYPYHTGGMFQDARASSGIYPATPNINIYYRSDINRVSYYENRYPWATDYQSYVDAVEEAKGKDNFMPPVTIVFIDHGWEDIDEGEWWDLKARAKAGYTVVLAPTMGAGLKDATAYIGESVYVNTTCIVNPFDPFASWPDADIAKANLAALNDKIKYYFDTSTDIEYLNDNYGGYQHNIPEQQPGTLLNPAFGLNPIKYISSNRYIGSDSDGADTYLAYEGFNTERDYTYDLPSYVVHQGAAGYAPNRGYQGLGYASGYGRTPPLYAQGGSDKYWDDGVIALPFRPQDRDGRPNDGTSMEWFIFDPARIDPYDTVSSGGKSGAQTYGNIYYTYGSADRYRLLGLRFVQPDENTWLMANTITRMYGPYQYPEFNMELTVNGQTYSGVWGADWWYRPSGSGTTWQHVNSYYRNTSGAQTASYIMGNVTDGTWGMIGLPSGIYYQYHGIGAYGHLGYKTEIVPAVHPTNPSLCVPLTRGVSQDRRVYSSGISTDYDVGSRIKLTTPTIVVESPTGSGDIVFWDASLSRVQYEYSRHDTRPILYDEMTAICSLYKREICKLIRTQKTGWPLYGNRFSEPDNFTPGLSTYGLPIGVSRFQTVTDPDVLAEGRMYNDTIVHPLTTGSAITNGIGPTFNLQYHNTGPETNRWWWSTTSKSYMETPTYDPGSGYTEEDYQDWQAFWWVKSLRATPGWAGYALSGQLLSYPAHPVPLWNDPEFDFYQQNWYKWQHNKVAAVMYGMPAAENAYDQRWTNAVTYGVPYSYWYDDVVLSPSEYQSSITTLLDGFRAMRLTLSHRTGDWRANRNVIVPDSETQKCSLYWGTVREDGAAFQDSYLSTTYPYYSGWEDNEHEYNQNDISRYYEHFETTPLPMLFLDNKMFAPTRHYRFDGQQPELFALAEDFYEVSNWPDLGASLFSYDNSSWTYMDLGYGIQMDGKDVPLGVNMADSKTRFTPQYPSFFRSAGGASSSAQRSGQIEFMMETPNIDDSRYATQTSYPRT